MTVRVTVTGASIAVLGSSTTREQLTGNEKTGRPVSVGAIEHPARATAGRAARSASVAPGLPQGLDLSTNGVAL
ncbi:hypothetical protein [Streptomyces sp. A5-4]|uniref:hypothetical protein n=1 Tax=Streptomyces sp. A5-4 TaxID=3384771 RepID=UPI003DA8A9CA